MKTTCSLAVISIAMFLAACSAPPAPDAGVCGGEETLCTASADCCGGYYCAGGRCMLAGGGGDSSGTTSSGGSAGGSTGGSTGSSSGGSPSGGGGAPCSLQGQGCADLACCSGVCNGGSCDCTSVGGNCGTDTQCCSGVCVGGICAACNGATALCDTNANCCSGNCADGICACAAAGIACGSSSDCCSGDCDSDSEVCQCAPFNITATGTFTDSASGFSATVSVQLELSDVTGGLNSKGPGPQYQLLGGIDTVTFASPTDASQVFFDVDGAIPSAAIGSYSSTTGTSVCGSVSLSFQTSGQNCYYQAQTAAVCNGPSGQDAAGAWAVTITSSSEACTGGTTSYYALHGTLTATMPDVENSPNTGTLNLTF